MDEKTTKRRRKDDLDFEAMDAKLDQTWFTDQLKTILTSLYDPSVMHTSPLTKLFEVDHRRSPMFALQQIVLDAIESLRPGEGTPQGSKNWRVYQILRRRYTEQRTQREVAAEVGLGLRHYQREEGLARQALAEYLWVRHDLENKSHNLNTSVGTHPLSRTEELEQLEESAPTQVINIGEVIQEVLETLQPLLASTRAITTYTPPEEPPLVKLKIPILRQALLSVVSMAIRYVPGGEVRIQTKLDADRVITLVYTTAQESDTAFRQRDHANAIKMVEQLVEHCDGSLKIISGQAGEDVFSSEIVLPALEQVTVLVIDDNADTRQLFQRYLSGSRYRFMGAENFETGLAQAQELAPQIIVLDVMMPGKDGWALLGQLRAHPRTCHIPVIVCTIVPHQGLASDLGAADFLRKPVNQATLLSALDRQLAQWSQKPC